MGCRYWFQWHAWGPWTVTRRFTIKTQPYFEGVKAGEPVVSGNGIEQERVCRRCGKVQIDRQER